MKRRETTLITTSHTRCTEEFWMEPLGWNKHTVEEGISPADLPFRPKSSNCKLVRCFPTLCLPFGYMECSCMFGPRHTVGNGVCIEAETKSSWMRGNGFPEHTNADLSDSKP